MNRWAVNWSEGMAMTPQHLQAADRHMHRRSAEAVDWFHPFAYGLRKSEISISNGQIALIELEARFRDGTVLAIPEDLESDALRTMLGDKLDAPGAIATVFLLIPTTPAGRHLLRRRECEVEGGEALPMDVDSRTPRAEVEFRTPRAELAVVRGATPPPGFESLVLATLGRSAGPGAPPVILEDVVPPLVVIDGWPPLARSVRDVASLLYGKIERLAAQWEGRPLGIDPKVPDDAVRLLKLMAFNAADVHLRAVCATPRLHPWYVFLELCRVAGQLAPFRPGRSVAKVPKYQHEDLGGCFAAILAEIKAALGDDEAAPYLAFPFQRRSGDPVKRVEVELLPAWEAERRPIYLGVATSLDALKCEEKLRMVDLTIAGRDQVGALNLLKKYGLDVSRPAAPIPGLPTDGEVHFFELHDVDGVWKDAWASRFLAIQVNPKRMILRDDEFEFSLGTDRDRYRLKFFLYVLNPPR